MTDNEILARFAGGGVAHKRLGGTKWEGSSTVADELVWTFPPPVCDVNCKDWNPATKPEQWALLLDKLGEKHCWHLYRGEGVDVMVQIFEAGRSGDRLVWSEERGRYKKSTLPDLCVSADNIGQAVCDACLEVAKKENDNDG